MLHTARMCGTDVVLVSEQYRNADEETGWYSDASGRSAVFVSSNIAVDAVGPLDIGFQWVQINGIRVYSVYYSPNATNTEYDLFLSRLESSVRSADGPVLVAGDFNAKRGSPTSDLRGDALAELASSLNLQVCNKGNRPTFTRGAIESFIDVTFVSQRLRRKVSNWRILDEDSLSLHWYIAFHITQTKHAIPLPTPKGWCWQKLNINKLHAFLDSRDIAEFINATSHDSPAQAVDAYLVAACDFCMPRQSYQGGKKPVHWWTQEIADLRKIAFASIRCFQRARKHTGPDACRELEQASRDALKSLKIAIRKSQEDRWRKLCQQVDDDPWGLPYKLVTK